MKPEQAAVIRDYYLESLQQEAQNTLKVLAAVPAKGSDYRPDAKSRTGFELAWHIASADAWFLDSIVAGKFEMGGEGEKIPPEIRSPQDIVTHYRKHYVEKLPALKAISNEKLIAMADFAGVFNFPLYIYFSWMNNHTIHHRGQLCAYLRAMGSKVPGIYGGSADEPFQMPT